MRQHTPEMFPDVPFEHQHALMATVTEMWSQYGTVLDTLGASVRFSMAPKLTNKIINYTLSWLKWKECKKTTWDLHLSDREMMLFIQKMTANIDLWLLPSIVQVGFPVTLRFLLTFGGRAFYMEQLLLTNLPFSLHKLVEEVIGTKALADLQMLTVQSRRMAAFCTLPTVEMFMACVPSQKRWKEKNEH